MKLVELLSAQLHGKKLHYIDYTPEEWVKRVGENYIGEDGDSLVSSAFDFSDPEEWSLWVEPIKELTFMEARAKEGIYSLIGHPNLTMQVNESGYIYYFSNGTTESQPIFSHRFTPEARYTKED